MGIGVFRLIIAMRLWRRDDDDGDTIGRGKKGGVCKYVRAQVLIAGRDYLVEEFW